MGIIIFIRSAHQTSIVNVMRESGCEVPEWMLSLKNPNKNLKKNLKKHAPERKSIKTTTKFDERQKKHKQQIIEDSKRKMQKRGAEQMEEDE